MKKTLALILTLILALGAAAAAEGFEYKANGYYAVMKYTGDQTELVIPDALQGGPVYVLAQNAIKNSAAVSIATPSSLRIVDNFNFYRHANLTSVTLNEGVVMIGESNFVDCDALKELTIPASVRYFGSNCVKYCDVLTTVRFLGECPHFEFNCFTGAHSDMVVYVPDDQLDAYRAALPQGLNIQPSGQNAVVVEPECDESLFAFDAESGVITGYSGCAGYVRIPDMIGGAAVREIGSGAFADNRILASVIIPEGVEILGDEAFDHNSYLVQVCLPSTLRHIGDCCFWVTAMTGIELNEGLETIGEKAFMDANLSGLTIPDSVTAIGAEAFHRCYISDLTLGAGVQTIGEKAFYSNSLKNMRFNMEAVPEVGAQALAGKNEAPSLTLRDGIDEEIYHAFAALMAEQFPACVVNKPEFKPQFPALDAEAGEPFMGTWNGVAVNDGSDYYTMDLLGMRLCVALRGDGSGEIIMDGEAAAGNWYMDQGRAMVGPTLEECMPADLDENGRMTIDFGGLVMILEKEGAVYDAPAIPEKPWPELDAENAKSFIGRWEAVSYTMDGETHDASLVGPMTLVLNDDGTAATLQDGETYELRWYADYGMAYVGPAMSAVAAVTFDGNGNIRMEQEGAVVLLKPYVEATPQPVISPTEGGEHLIGAWLDDVGNKLTLAADGSMTLTYASDGWTDQYAWAVTDGAAVVTAGRWEGCPITLENGILTITNGEGIFQIFSADGDLSAYYGGAPATPEAQPIGSGGEPYFGSWAADMGGMEIILTLNPDGTCAMDMMGVSEPGVWAVIDGKASVMGDTLSIDGEGQLVMESQGMVFVRREDGAFGGEMSEDEQMLALLAMLAEMELEEETGAEAAESAGASADGDPYIGVRYVMTGSVVQGIPLSAEQLGCAGDYVIFNADGSAELVMSGIPVKTLGWTRGTVNVLGTEYDGFSIDYYGTYYNFAITDDGLLLDYFGMLRTYERE